MLFDLFYAVWLCESLVAFSEAGTSFKGLLSCSGALKIYFEMLPEHYYQWEMVFGIQDSFHHSTKELDRLQIKMVLSGNAVAM